MKILFIHQNFPGQFKSLAPKLHSLGHRVVALGMAKRSGFEFPYFRYRPEHQSSQTVHPFVGDYETKVIRAQACAKACLNLKERGFMPDLIYVHPGWGESLLLKEVWPDAKQLHFVEYFYGSDGKDVDFDPEFSTPSFESRCRLNIKNTNNMINLQLMDWGLSPTHWQRSTTPKEYHERISVIHDGIDTKVIRPNDSAILDVTNDRGERLVLSHKDEVITFVNRNLEPSRGYHQFMRSLPSILSTHSTVQVIIIGGDGTSYGAQCPEGTWKQKYLEEVRDQIDITRVHFLGNVDYLTYQKALQISNAHVYLSYPFVLSWSMIEAMAMALPVIASDTAPVREVINHKENGYLVDFFDANALADRVLDVLSSDQTTLRKSARETVIEHYDLDTVCLPKQLALLENLVNKH